MAADRSEEVSLTWLLDLERVDRDVFLAASPDYPGRRNLFGGQVAAQSLRAAATTVDQPHLPHSLHLYFLRPGRVGEPVVLYVDRIRDGRSFTTRTVVARQDGEAILTMSCSFHREEPDVVDYGPPMASVASPEASAGADPFGRGRGSGYVGLDVARVPAPPEAEPPVRIWMRVAEPLPDDPVVHACAIAYLTDTETGTAPVAATRRGFGDLMMTSLDHALHFHRPVRADDWLLLDFEAVSIGRGRGMTQATVHAADGTLGATIRQELLMRERNPGT
jgi:acyl-CoA thioesterase-2